MQIVQGLVNEVINRKQDADDPNALFLEVNGRAIRIDVPDERGDVLATREGDSVVVAGYPRKPVFKGLAFRNLSQKQATYQVSGVSDSAGAGFFLFFGSLCLWAGLTPEEAPNRFGIPAWIITATSPLSILFGVAILLYVVDKYAAAFLVDSAALQTCTGTARIVPSEGQEGRVADAELGGCRIALDLVGGFVIESGDVLAVTAEQLPDRLRGLSYRNVTRSVNGKSWVTTGWLRQIAVFLVLEVLIATLFVDRSLTDPWNIPAIGLGILFMVIFLQFIFHRFYRWRYYREARRRTTAAAAGLARP